VSSLATIRCTDYSFISSLITPLCTSLFPFNGIVHSNAHLVDYYFVFSAIPSVGDSSDSCCPLSIPRSPPNIFSIPYFFICPGWRKTHPEVCQRLPYVSLPGFPCTIFLLGFGHICSCLCEYARFLYLFFCYTQGFFFLAKFRLINS